MHNNQMQPYQDILRGAWQRTRYLLSRFKEDRCSENAAALTYMSLFAMVPLLTVLYTMASAIPTFQGLEEQMQEFLFQHLMPDTSSEVETYLSEFSRQAKNLTGPGIVFLVITAVLMLRNIEKAFNLIWRARENRSAVSSFLLYWAVLSLAPVALGLALGISTYLASFSHVLDEYDIFGAKAVLLKVSPLVLSTLSFTLLYIAVPNCRVPFKHTLVGGLATALAFHAARAVFTDLVVGSSYTFIYGAFAAVPLFLLWIYLSWNIVLMGGILVHSLSAYQDEEQACRPNVLKALDVLYLFWTKQQAGDTVRETELLNNSHLVTRGLDSVTWRELRDILIEQQVITQSDRGHYLLARDLHSVPFWQLKTWVNDEQPLEREDITADMNWQENAYRLLRGQRHQQRELMHMSLVELYQQ
ncbi:YihY family inner membrane protein [Halioglobus sp. HI00S01]|uniref:YihY family inner membrane protein n=1 Tax=Halioglobus sp. HI00S01 TaxID=1822214 RepID=UPI000B0B9DBE|nr:YihY family inner membrane protein [Halioglobus sp. HI00S01]